MNAADGSGQINLSNNDSALDDTPVFSPDGTKIAYESYGIQTSNPRGRLRGLRDESLGWVGTDKPLQQRRRRR